MKVKIVKAFKSATIPAYAHEDDGCFDLSSSEDVMLLPRAVTSVPTGLKIEVPKGYVLKVYPRSGISRDHGILPANAVPIIDCGFTGEIILPMYNRGMYAYHVKKGDRIVQAMLIPRPKVEFEEVDELDDTERGEGSFGSSGMK